MQEDQDRMANENELEKENTQLREQLDKLKQEIDEKYDLMDKSLTDKKATSGTIEEEMKGKIQD